MSHSNLADKLTQYNEFFSIEHKFSVNAALLPNKVSAESFEQLIPVPFLLSSDNANIDQSALRSIQGLRGVSHQLSDYLQHQSHKIDLLVGYILKQHDDPSTRANGIEFGGSGIKIISEKNYQLGDLVELKLFLDVENVAIYCHGEIIDIQQNENDKTYTFIFQQIREIDQDILVRASLHIQSKQLQALAQARRQNQQ